MVDGGREWEEAVRDLPRAKDIPLQPKVVTVVTYRCPKCETIMDDYAERWTEPGKPYRCEHCQQAIGNSY